MPKRKNRNKQQSEFSITFRTQRQEEAWNTFQRSDVLFLTGPAGAGKTFLAMAFAIHEVLKMQARRIILTRPIVESGESLGFLPGSFSEKVDPYMTPLFDCYKSLLPGATMKNRVIESSFEIAPIAYMRGRTFDNAICIFDEAQNATRSQIKLFLSRFGRNSKIIITGDPDQTDLGTKSGFQPILEAVQGLSGVGVTRFESRDIVRHPLVAEILARI